VGQRSGAVGSEDVTRFTLLLRVTARSGESECCEHTYVLVRSTVVVTDKGAVNLHVFPIRIYSVTKSIVQKQSRFGLEFGRISWRSNILKWTDDHNVHGNVVNKSFSLHIPFAYNRTLNE
jgi:hypothetical protein